MAKILLADDSAHAQRMGAKILGAEGHQVVTVGNGQAALQALEKSVPDLVVADIYMPGRDGFEVCQFIKADARLKNVPVLLTIGAMEPYDPERGRRSRADGLVTKPLESSNLIATVKQLLANSKPSAARRLKRGAAPPAESVAATEQAVSSEREQPTTQQAGAPAQNTTVIPEEMSEQPVSMLTELPESFPANGTPVETAVLEADDSAPAELVVAAVSDPVSASNEPSSSDGEMFETADGGRTAEVLQIEAVEAESVWSAEPVAVSGEDEKLFDGSGDVWPALAKLAEEEAPEPAFSPNELHLGEPEPSGTSSEPPSGPIALPADSAPATGDHGVSVVGDPLPAEPELESFDSLSAVLAAPPIVPPAAVSSQDGAPPITVADSTPSADSTEDLSPASSAAANSPNATEPVASSESPVAVAGPADESVPSAPAEPVPAVDELVRQTVEQMLPRLVDEIVGRVLQALKP